MLPNADPAYFTTDNNNSVVCQCCLQSFEDGTQLYFMQDKKPDGRGKHVCAGCHRCYLEKTEAREKQLTLGWS